ncbi:MAG TPA: hypothetical protein VGJ99_09030, partial [Actinomycetota bacterium]
PRGPRRLPRGDPATDRLGTGRTRVPLLLGGRALGGYTRFGGQAEASAWDEERGLRRLPPPG